MKTFRQWLGEGLVFSAHNGHILHKRIVDHFQKNIEDYHQKIKSGDRIDINPNKLDKNIPHDFHLGIVFRRTHGSYSAEDLTGGGFGVNQEKAHKNPEKHKPRIDLQIGHHGEYTPDSIMSHLKSDAVKGLIVHEHDHLEVYRHLKKHKGIGAALDDYNKGSRDTGEYPSPTYYNNPGEVRAYSREIAVKARKNSKFTPTQHNDVDFMKKASVENLRPLKSYLGKLHTPARKPTMIQKIKKAISIRKKAAQ